MWVATLDVEEAFDKVHHTALFDASLRNCINASVVSCPRRLYFGIRGYVAMWKGADSRTFEVGRAVRQGDPQSPVLFNLVLDGALAEASVITTGKARLRDKHWPRCVG